MSADDRLEPTVTSPKDAAAGLRASFPGIGSITAVPVPDRVTVVTESVASLEMEIEALKVPAAFGVKTTLRGTLCLAVRVTGRLGAVTWKYLVEMATLVMVTVAEPEFVAVVEIALLLPAFTLPKARDELVREIVPLCDCLVGFVELVLSPWQPDKLHNAPSRRRVKIIFERTSGFVAQPLASRRRSLPRGGVLILPSIERLDCLLKDI